MNLDAAMTKTILSWIVKQRITTHFDGRDLLHMTTVTRRQK
jgi:hypothetical protein